MQTCILYILFLSGVFGSIYLAFNAYITGYNHSVWFLSFGREAKCDFWWPLSFFWRLGYNVGKKGSGK